MSIRRLEHQSERDFKENLGFSVCIDTEMSIESYEKNQESLELHFEPFYTIIIEKMAIERLEATCRRIFMERTKLARGPIQPIRNLQIT